MCPEPKIMYPYVESETVPLYGIRGVDTNETSHVTIDGLAILTPNGIRTVIKEKSKIIIEVIMENGEIWKKII